MATDEIKPTTKGFQDLTHRTFGKLFVERYDGRVDGKPDHWWQCTCACGNTKRAKGSMLRHGNTTSCGCLYRESRGVAQRTHGLSRTPEHVIWCGIKGRCRTPTNSLYEKYGARGVKMCGRWGARDGFVAFLADMGERPSPELSVDRIKGELHYSCGKHDECDECRENGWPANCHWATEEEQANNKTTNVNVTHDGVTLTLAQWARKAGINYVTLYSRLKVGVPFGLAITTPVEECKKRHPR